MFSALLAVEAPRSLQGIFDP